MEKKGLKSEVERLAKENERLTAELGRLNALLRTPEIHDFAKAVVREATYQRERWGKEHDADKSDDNWFWTLGWLAGKAVTDPHEVGDTRTPLERKLHRIITAAALACNWHAAVLEREKGKK